MSRFEFTYPERLKELSCPHPTGGQKDIFLNLITTHTITIPTLLHTTGIHFGRTTI